MWLVVYNESSATNDLYLSTRAISMASFYLLMYATLACLLQERNACLEMARLQLILGIMAIHLLEARDHQFYLR